MKKTGLFKIMMFILLGMVLITWIFSASTFSTESLSELGMVNIGFFDFWQIIFKSFEFEFFIQVFILLLSIGAFYAVLGKTGKYRAWIERIVKRLKGNELAFLLVSAFVISIITSIFDFGLGLFIFIPLLISIMLAMGYSKITSIVATIGAMLVGTIGSTLGANTAGAINSVLGAELSNGLLVKIILYFVSLGVLFFYLYKAPRTNKIDEKEDTFLGEKESNKYSIGHIIAIFVILFVILVLGCTAWTDTFNIEFFSNLNDTITGWSPKMPYLHFTSAGVEHGVQETAIVGKLLGTIGAFGEWYYAEMSIMCLLASLVLICRYKIKDGFEVMAEGARKMLRPALLVVLTYTIVYFAANTMFYPTIASYILNITGKFNLFFSTIAMALSSALHVDMLYVSYYTLPQIAALGVSTQTAGILGQGIYGVTMFIAPTSTLLVLGLSYLGIPYKEWIKKTWKLTLSLLAVVVIATIVTMLIFK